MPVKWNDNTERMLLIKFLEQNPGLKLDVGIALEKWPSDLETPTKRSLLDRFNLLKKQIRESAVPSTGGQGPPVSHGVCTPQSVPKTPKARAKAILTKNQTVKANPVSDTDTDTKSDEDGTTATAKSTSSKPFKSKLLNVNTPGNRGTKRKRTASKSDESEPSMSDDDNAVSSSASEPATSPSKPASTARRSLPPRRSKSKTPANYANTEDSDETITLKTARGKVTRKLDHTHDDDAEDDDSDGSFNPKRDAIEGANGKKRASWMDRVATADGMDEELQD